MFANRFTVLVDACSLVPVLPRNVLLSLAEAEFFRVRWSDRILVEMGRALIRLYADRGVLDGSARAARARAAMERAFEGASVQGHESLAVGITWLPDLDDAHVIAAAVKTRASVIVTENLRHFPARVLGPLDLEAKTADEFIADTIDLDAGRAVPALRQMRARFKRPEIDAQTLLLKMEAAGLTRVVDALREHTLSL